MKHEKPVGVMTFWIPSRGDDSRKESTRTGFLPRFSSWSAVVARTGIGRTAERNRNAGGFTLLLSVLVVSLALALGLAIFSITIKGLLLSSVSRESQFAIYAADTGIECALFWDQRADAFSTSTPSSITCNNATIPNMGGQGYDVPSTFTLDFSPQPYCAVVSVIKSGGGGSGSVQTGAYDTFNNLQTNGQFTIVGNQVTRNGAGSNVYALFSNLPQSGKYYFEIFVNSFSGSPQPMVGVVGSDRTLNSSGFTQGGDGFMYNLQGEYYINDAYGSTGGVNYGSGGSLIAIAYDATSKKIWIGGRQGSGGSFAWVNRGTGAPNPSSGTGAFHTYSGATGNRRLAMSNTNNSGSWQLTYNFGASSFAYAPPSGFSPLTDAGIQSQNYSFDRTQILSQGYNTCDTGNPRRVERTLRATY